MIKAFEKSKPMLRELQKQERKTIVSQHKKESKEELRRQVGPAAAAAAVWVPHPRTGIYYPKGNEWVMEDIPKGAASLKQTYWFRTTESEL